MDICVALCNHIDQLVLCYNCIIDIFGDKCNHLDPRILSPVFILIRTIIIHIKAICYPWQPELFIMTLHKFNSAGSAVFIGLHPRLTHPRPVFIF